MPNKELNHESNLHTDFWTDIIQLMNTHDVGVGEILSLILEENGILKRINNYRRDGDSSYTMLSTGKSSIL